MGELQNWFAVSALPGGGTWGAPKPALLGLAGHTGHTHSWSVCDIVTGLMLLE